VISAFLSFANKILKYAQDIKISNIYLFIFITVMETIFVTTFQTREYTDKCFTGLTIQAYVCNLLDTNNSAENSQSSFTPSLGSHPCSAPYWYRQLLEQSIGTKYLKTH